MNDGLSRVRYQASNMIDSIIVHVIGNRYFFTTAIAIVTKFAWVSQTPSLTTQAADAFARFSQAYPPSIRAVQTDNGSKYLLGSLSGAALATSQAQAVQKHWIDPRRQSCTLQIEIKPEACYGELQICPLI